MSFNVGDIVAHGSNMVGIVMGVSCGRYDIRWRILPGGKRYWRSDALRKATHGERATYYRLMAEDAEREAEAELKAEEERKRKPEVKAGQVWARRGGTHLILDGAILACLPGVSAVPVTSRLSRERVREACAYVGDIDTSELASWLLTNAQRATP